MSHEPRSLASRWSVGNGPASEAETRPSVTQATVRPHVCFVATNLYPILAGSTSIELAGGAEIQQAVLAKILRADGFRVSVLGADYGQPEVVDCAGVHVHRMPPAGTRGIKGLRFIYPYMTDIVAGLKRIGPDIVYFRAAGGGAAAAAWYARRCGKQFVYACASDVELQRNAAWPSDRRDAFSFRMGLRFADGVLVQNICQRRLLKENFGKDGLIVPNCYMEPAAGRAASNGHILWVGTVKSIKRPEVFVELARKFPSKQFTMVGGADLQGEGGQVYYQRARDMAAGTPNLDFVGYVPFAKVGRHFDNASMFVNTSDVEGFPNTFLQAWIRGVPTLSFVRPEVIPGEPGTIVCRDIEDMVWRIGELMTSPERWRDASESCRDHFSKTHSVEAVLQGYRDLFEGLNGRREA